MTLELRAFSTLSIAWNTILGSWKCAFSLILCWQMHSKHTNLPTYVKLSTSSNVLGQFRLLGWANDKTADQRPSLHCEKKVTSLLELLICLFPRKIYSPGSTQKILNCGTVESVPNLQTSVHTILFFSRLPFYKVWQEPKQAPVAERVTVCLAIMQNIHPSISASPSM